MQKVEGSSPFSRFVPRRSQTRQPDTARALRHVNCCSPAGYRSIFGGKSLQREARRYRREGLTGSAAWLLGALRDDGVTDRSVLEVGGGIGGLQLELLDAGASHVTNVEIIDSYESVARSLITEHRVEDRVERHVADYARCSDQTPPADIVVMHRVICCYPDPDALISAACSRAHDRVAITIPRETWWVRLAFAAMNAWLRLRQIAFRGYIHPERRLLERADSFGFHAARHDHGVVWQSFILQRATVGED